MAPSVISKSARTFAALSEASICMSLGVRSALSPPLLLRTVVTGGLIGMGWLWFFWLHVSKLFEVALACSATLVLGLLVPLGSITQYTLAPTPAVLTTNTALDALGAQFYNLGAQLLNVGSVLVHILAFAAIVLVVLWSLAYLVSGALIARTLFWQRLQERVRRGYPSLADIPVALDVPRRRPSRLAIAVSIVGLFIPIVSGVLLVGLLCYWLVRVFFTSVVADSLTREQRTAVLGDSVGVSVLLGALLLLTALIPVVNLITPVLGGAAATHMYRRAAHRLSQSVAARSADTRTSQPSTSV